MRIKPLFDCILTKQKVSELKFALFTKWELFYT